MVQQITVSLFKDVVLQMFWEVLYFPVWWYSVGLTRTARFCLKSIKSMEMRLGLKIWVVNIFKPMYGQRDIPGKIISFFMRVSQIIGRGLILIFWSIMMVGLIVVWICLPIIVILGIVINLVAI